MVKQKYQEIVSIQTGAVPEQGSQAGYYYYDARSNTDKKLHFQPTSAAEAYQIGVTQNIPTQKAFWGQGTGAPGGGSGRHKQKNYPARKQLPTPPLPYNIDKRAEILKQLTPEQRAGVSQGTLSLTKQTNRNRWDLRETAKGLAQRQREINLMQELGEGGGRQSVWDYDNSMVTREHPSGYTLPYLVPDKSARIQYEADQMFPAQIMEIPNTEKFQLDRFLHALKMPGESVQDKDLFNKNRWAITLQELNDASSQYQSGIDQYATGREGLFNILNDELNLLGGDSLPQWQKNYIQNSMESERVRTEIIKGAASIFDPAATASFLLSVPPFTNRIIFPDYQKNMIENSEFATPTSRRDELNLIRNELMAGIESGVAAGQKSYADDPDKFIARMVGGLAGYSIPATYLSKGGTTSKKLGKAIEATVETGEFAAELAMKKFMPKTLAAIGGTIGPEELAMKAILAAGYQGANVGKATARALKTYRRNLDDYIAESTGKFPDSSSEIDISGFGKVSPDDLIDLKTMQAGITPESVYEILPKKFREEYERELNELEDPQIITDKMLSGTRFDVNDQLMQQVQYQQLQQQMEQRQRLQNPMDYPIGSDLIFDFPGADMQDFGQRFDFPPGERLAPPLLDQIQETFQGDAQQQQQQQMQQQMLAFDQVYDSAQDQRLRLRAKAKSKSRLRIDLPKRKRDAIKKLQAARKQSELARKRFLMDLFKNEIAIPEIIIPRVNIPQIRIPEVLIPQVRIPQVHVPRVHVPQVHVPQINIPNAIVPRVHVPEVHVPEVTGTQVEVPKVHIPKVEIYK